MHEALANLSRADERRLRTVARLRAWHPDLDPADLLQEAKLKALAGDRRCPVETKLVAFLSNAMRSIAHNWTKQVNRLEVVNTDPDAVPSDVQIRQPRFPDLGRPPRLDALVLFFLDQFPGDPTAQQVLRGIAKDLRGQELRDETGLNEVQLATVRRRIRRRLKSLQPLPPQIFARKRRRSIGREPGERAASRTELLRDVNELSHTRRAAKAPRWHRDLVLLGSERCDRIVDWLVEDVCGLSDEQVLAESFAAKVRDVLSGFGAALRSFGAVVGVVVVGVVVVALFALAALPAHGAYHGWRWIHRAWNHRSGRRSPGT